MTLDLWLESARRDAYDRGLPELATLLATLARSTAALRAADEAYRRRATPPAARDLQSS